MKRKINTENEVINLYTAQKGVDETQDIEIGIIAGSEPKKFGFRVDKDADTTDCRFDGYDNDHEKNIFTYDKTKLPANISIINHQPKSIEGTISFDYDKINLIEYLFLTDSKLKNLPNTVINSKTCRNENQLSVKAVPDIKWEGYMLIMNKNSESYSQINMPADKDSFGDPIVTDDKGKPTKKNIFQIHQKKSRDTGTKAKKINQDFTGEVHLKAAINDSKDLKDYGVLVEDKLKIILDRISLFKKALDEISHRDKADAGRAKGTMTSLKPFVGDSKTKVALPVFIDFSWPPVRLGGGWYWKYIEEQKKVKCIGNLQFGFEPLTQGKGGIDLIAAAEYIPIVKPVLKALKYVKKGAQWMCDNTPVKIDAEVYFNLYVKGRIDLRQTIDFYNSSYNKTDLRTTLLLGIELGFKIKATIEKVIYTKNDKAGSEEISKTGFDGQLSAEAECGFIVTATGGNDEKAPYIQATVDFTGITLKVVGKLSIYRPSKKTSNYGINKKFDLIDYHKNMIDPLRYDFM